MQKRMAAVAIASASVAVIGAGTGVVAASPSASHHSTGVFSACLTASNTLINVTKSPAHRIHCPSDTTRVTWNARGPRGHRGPTGANGAKGNTGAPGANGSSVLNGIGAPNSSVGNPGDFYIDTQNWLIYGPKTANGWPATGHQLQGPSGGQGARGQDGITEVDVVRNDGTVDLPPDDEFHTVATYNLESGGLFVVHAKVVVSEDDQGPLNVVCQLGDFNGQFLEETPDMAVAVVGSGDSEDTGDAPASTLALTNDYDTTNGDGRTFPIALSCRNNHSDFDSETDAANEQTEPDGDADDAQANFAVIDISKVNELDDDNVGGFVPGGQVLLRAQ